MASKYDNLKSLYYTVALAVSEFLPSIPQLKLTNAISYFGRAYRTNGKVHTIALSKHHLWLSDEWMDEQDMFLIIDTIAHELAHCVYFYHSEEHRLLTIGFREIYYKILEIERCA